LLLPRSFASYGLAAFWEQQHAWICFCLQRRVHDLKNPLNFKFVGGFSLPMTFGVVKCMSKSMKYVLKCCFGFSKQFCFQFSCWLLFNKGSVRGNCSCTCTITNTYKVRNYCKGQQIMFISISTFLNHFSEQRAQSNGNVEMEPIEMSRWKSQAFWLMFAKGSEWCLHHLWLLVCSSLWIATGGVGGYSDRWQATAPQ